MGKAHQNTALPLLSIEADEFTYKASHIYLLRFLLSPLFKFPLAFMALGTEQHIPGGFLSISALASTCFGKNRLEDGRPQQPDDFLHFLVVVSESINSRVVTRC